MISRLPGFRCARFLLCMTLAGTASMAPPVTTVQDTLYKADGTLFNGLLLINWRSFEGPNSSNVPGNNLSVQVANGKLWVKLIPTTTAPTAAYYSVRYVSVGGIQFTELWSVPPSSTPLLVKNVRIEWPPASSSGSALTEVQISDVVGLAQELAVRPLKGLGYTQSRAAVINAAGELDGAVGSLSDCLRVDGTTGPCGASGSGTPAPTFVDAETPTGALNGVNADFTLASFPNPAGSLLLYRNGILQKQLSDYSLTGNTINFVGASIPETGDCLLASYRIDGSSEASSPGFVDAATPAGTVDGVNTGFTLGYFPSPASSLLLFRNGVLQEQGSDYSLAGNVITFASASIPQAGDSLQASYRIGGSSTSSPQVLCSYTGNGTNLATLSSLGACTIPASVLQSGDRVEIGFDFSHEGSASGFTFELRWGGTVLQSQSVGSAELLVTGRASAAVHESGTQLSVQSWGSAQGFTPSVTTAPDALSSPLTVDFLGKMATSTADTVTLRNFTVTRFPARIAP